MTANEFQKKHLGQFIEKTERPRWQGELSDSNKWIAKTLAEKRGRKAFPRQLEAVIAPMFHQLGVENRKSGVIVGKMGTGKTQMSYDILYLLFKQQWEKRGAKALFLASGSKHIRKMAREAMLVLGDTVEVRVIKTSPRKTPVAIEVDGKKKKYREVLIDDAIEAKTVPGKIILYILSKDTGKGGMKKVPLKVDKCPSCGNGFEEKRSFGRTKTAIPDFCPQCFSPLFRYDAGKKRILSIKEKINRAGKSKTDKLFNLLIVDEVHEMQDPDSLQTRMYKALVKRSAKTLIMTGTLANGYASSVFHILYPIIPHAFKMHGFGYENINAFVDLYGAKEEISSEENRNGRSVKKTVAKELPKINDRIVGLLAPYSVWLSLEDLEVEMPPMKEKVVLVEKGIATEWINKALLEIDKLSVKRELLVENLKERGLSSVLVNRGIHKTPVEEYLLNNPTIPYVRSAFGEAEREKLLELKNEIDDKELAKSIDYALKPAEIPPVNPNILLPKEEELVKIVRSEMEEGRRILLYGQFVRVNRLFDRLSEVLKREIDGIKVDVVPESLAAEKVEEYCVNSDADVLMVSQSRVATGLDLVQYHTVIFYELNKSVRTVEQAKSRPHRPIGQDREVRVYYLGYKGSYQERVIESTAQKMRAAAAVNGEVAGSETLARLYDYDPEMTIAIEEMAQYIKTEAADTGLTNLQKSEIALYYEGLLEAGENRLADEPDKIGTDIPAFESEVLCPQIEVAKKAKASVKKSAPPKKSKKFEETPLVKVKKESNGQLAFDFF